jgi:hypothetical protein
MGKKDKYEVFSLISGRFTNEEIDNLDYSEYIDLLDAERKIASRMIKARLDKINPDDYKESTD